MSFSYTDPTASELDAFRFTIGDTDSAQPLLQDEEIQYILASTKSETKRLMLAYRQCATRFAKIPTDRKLGPQSEKSKDRLEYFKALADKYEKLSVTSGAPPLPAYSSEKVFDKGMMPNV